MTDPNLYAENVAQNALALIASCGPSPTPENTAAAPGKPTTAPSKAEVDSALAELERMMRGEA